MAGIGVILNPHSKSNRQNPGRARRLGFIVGDKGSCHETQTMEDVRHLAAEFKSREIEILGISGGDGTIHQTLTTFINGYGDTPLPRIAFLRGGTMNTVATSLGITGSPEEILSNVIVHYHQAGNGFTNLEVDTLKVNGGYGFIFGLGLICRYIERYTRRPASMGWAALLLMRIMASALFNAHLSRELCERLDAEVTIGDQRTWPFANYAAVFAGTVHSFGFGFKPLYRAREKDRHFHIRGFSMTPRQILFGFPRFIMGLPTSSPNYLEDIADDVRITLPTPKTYMLDGDVYGPVSEICIATGPRLTLVRV